MNDKHFQLQWYNGDRIAQDHELEKFIIDNDISRIKYIGDSQRLKNDLGRESQCPQLCIFVVNSFFTFDDVVNRCNQELGRLPINGMLYLCLNKFLARAQSDTNAPEDYDVAILDFISRRVRYPLIQYYSGKLDGGQRFNWVHPLTRFYFINANFK